MNVMAVSRRAGRFDGVRDGYRGQHRNSFARSHPVTRFAVSRRPSNNSVRRGLPGDRLQPGPNGSCRDEPDYTILHDFG